MTVEAPVRQAPPADLGALLRSVRIRTGVGLRAAARTAGISHGYLRDLETGKRCPSVAIVAELLRVLPFTDEEAAILTAAGLPDRGRSHPLRNRKPGPRGTP